MGNELWGPLAGLIGEWEGDAGIDVSFHNAKSAVGETKYRERVTMAPFGPVENGKQCLYGLDYRMSAWRLGEDSAFHTEIGYCKVTVKGGTFEYDSMATYVHGKGGEIGHSDRNTLKRIG